MNGDWMKFGKQPEKFKEMFIKVAQAVRKDVPDVAMVWSPNYWAGAGDDYAPYWPGAEYVDCKNTNIF
jgi:beta-mannanase